MYTTHADTPDTVGKATYKEAIRGPSRFYQNKIKLPVPHKHLLAFI